ncbi:tRNA methyltransferase, has a role in tRNA modification [Fusarium piperis]|uniref:tRNA methyltransferase, has a role in tRNA modification n=1 Tax=Fusarium piperis TaxID=1435070 RepID=A0A9W8WLK8_9HYPO|nr:tRNA methyltransferase, has a role in tRNA modification [Fusarium piperis]
MASGSPATPAGDQGDGPLEQPNPQQEGAQPQEPPSTAVTEIFSPSEAEEAPETYEATHVHAVYEAIAPHFSATRHKPWPRVASFLQAQPPGSIGLDVGCGNGKYLRVNPAVHLLGSDRSPALVKLARTELRRPRADGKHDDPAISDVDVAVADGFALPYRRAAADFVICIAVVHHMSTRARRQEAVAALLDCVTPKAGRVLVYVWALEQASSRRGWDAGCDQDRLVSWVMRKPKGEEPGGTYQRYYHLYREGELEEDVVAAGGKVEESGYERDNWWVVCSRPAAS